MSLLLSHYREEHDKMHRFVAAVARDPLARLTMRERRDCWCFP